MKYNKRLLLIVGISAVLLVGSILAFTSCSKKPSEDTNTSINDNLDDNNSSDGEQINNSEKDKDNNNEDDKSTEDKKDEIDGSKDDNLNSENN